MPYDMDGEWPGFEPPLCPDCLDVPMDETERGYRCSFCDFETIWNEESGKWIDLRGGAMTWEIGQWRFYVAPRDDSVSDSEWIWDVRQKQWGWSVAGHMSDRLSALEAGLNAMDGIERGQYDITLEIRLNDGRKDILTESPDMPVKQFIPRLIITFGFNDRAYDSDPDNWELFNPQVNMVAQPEHPIGIYRGYPLVFRLKEAAPK